MLDRLLDHKADEHFFEEVHAPIFYLCRELLRRNIEKVSQLLGVVEPEKVRKSSRHEHLERDEIALAKLVMKEGEKPGKFLLPHGIILLEFGPYRIFMEGNPEGIQNQRPLGIMELSEEAASAPRHLPYRPHSRHQLWLVDMRYLVQLDGHWLYSLGILEGYARMMLAGMASEHHELPALLPRLFAALSPSGCPEGIVSDHGAVFHAEDDVAILKALEIEPTHIELRKPWQNLIE